VVTHRPQPRGQPLVGQRDGQGLQRRGRVEAEQAQGAGALGLAGLGRQGQLDQGRVLRRAREGGGAFEGDLGRRRVPFEHDLVEPVRGALAFHPDGPEAGAQLARGGGDGRRVDRAVGADAGAPAGGGVEQADRALRQPGRGREQHRHAHVVAHQRVEVGDDAHRALRVGVERGEPQQQSLHEVQTSLAVIPSVR
jgi:hypothetical protein